ncbi:M20 metallopeptidase family protein [Candidatus Xianfuyuplasma coldseepsis]|uniref:Amidohydrolase n=1 Tax=Candidatus Xianfuyuplasma coldseepsis TaxID=2782163 RepID=A0A7L7KPG6_9MOLU|nr:M20 family metallopeptidase [Xianfuyuplasma coldseepsis]QMS84593.1 amidohydrolase [Xianfuyuplasma coldseepsis]
MTNKLQQFREDLHQIPETSFTEFKTQAYLQKALQAMGYQPQVIATTGLYVYLDQGHSTSIAFRTDIDALPVHEETGVGFASTHDGYMHACGHDGHMAMMLGVADYLQAKLDQLQKNVLLIFQPAEESIGGAKQIVDTGLLEQCHVEAIFGIHLFPEIEEGIIASKPGPFMAMANEVNVTVIGTSAHGAMPHKGVDANIILAKLLVDFETIQTRMISPLQPTIMTFGHIQGGHVRNQISDRAIMEGTIRSFDKTVQEQMVQAMNQFARHYEQLYGCTITIDVNDGYLPVINDEHLYQTWKDALYEFPLHEFKQPFMIAEDFSFYGEVVPSVFFFVGAKNDKQGFTYSLHHPKFNFNPQVLQVGLKAYQTLLKKLGVLHE